MGELVGIHKFYDDNNTEWYCLYDTERRAYKIIEYQNCNIIKQAWFDEWRKKDEILLGDNR